MPWAQLSPTADAPNGRRHHDVAVLPEHRRQPEGHTVKTDLPFSQTVREELANAASHGLGCVLALAAMPVLASQVDAERHPIRHLGVNVFIATMVLMYLVSAVYHALPVGQASATTR